MAAAHLCLDCIIETIKTHFQAKMIKERKGKEERKIIVKRSKEKLISHHEL